MIFSMRKSLEGISRIIDGELIQQGYRFSGNEIY